MSVNVDDWEIPITCPKCGHTTNKTIGGIKTCDEFTCVCGQRIKLDAEEAIRDLENIDSRFGAEPLEE
jgi:hypothetical protein